MMLASSIKISFYQNFMKPQNKILTRESFSAQKPTTLMNLEDKMIMEQMIMACPTRWTIPEKMLSNPLFYKRSRTNEFRKRRIFPKRKTTNLLVITLKELIPKKTKISRVSTETKEKQNHFCQVLKGKMTKTNPFDSKKLDYSFLMYCYSIFLIWVKYSIDFVLYEGAI